MTIQSGIFRQRFSNNFPPLTKPDLNVSLHGNVAFQEVRHGRAFQFQQIDRDFVYHFLSSSHGGLVLTEKHRAVYREVVIVDAVSGIKIHTPLSFGDFEISLYAFLVPVQSVAILPALNVDVGRHVDEMSGVWHQFT